MNDNNKENLTQNLPLSETLQTLRKELQLAQLQSQNEDILFEMEKVEIELKVVISQNTKGVGGIEFWVIKAGGEIEESNETTHCITLTLIPKSKTTNRVVVKGQTKEKPSED